MEEILEYAQRKDWREWLELIELLPGIIPFFKASVEDYVTPDELCELPPGALELANELKNLADRPPEKKGDPRFRKLIERLKEYIKDLTPLAEPHKSGNRATVQKKHREALLQNRTLNGPLPELSTEDEAAIRTAQFSPPDFGDYCLLVAGSYGVRLDVLEKHYKESLQQSSHWTEYFQWKPCDLCQNRVHLTNLELQDVNDMIRGAWKRESYWKTRDGHNKKASQIELTLRRKFPGFKPGKQHTNTTWIFSRKVIDFTLGHSCGVKFVDGKPIIFENPAVNIIDLPPPLKTNEASSTKEVAGGISPPPVEELICPPELEEKLRGLKKRLNQGR